MAQINRNGIVVFGDASLSVWEEGLGGNWDERQTWEKTFKTQVFKRIIQTLNRLGWTCVIPEDKIKEYGRAFAEMFRYCYKGNLKADLSISGRHIELVMFQNLNAPDRPEYEGRYQFEKELHMPYLLRLEMERTRRKIRDYLCNVFSGYTFRSEPLDGRRKKCGPGHLNALDWVAGCYKTSTHFKGNPETYQIADYHRKSADGVLLDHGQRVWFADRKGRICTGTAYYNINNMWWVIWGKYGHTNKACFELFTAQPENLRKKRNERLRATRLRSLLDGAVETMAFERAAQLRDLLFPKHEAA